MSTLMWAVSLAVGLGLLLIFRRLMGPKGRREPPDVSWGLPLVGPAKEFGVNPCTFIQRLHEKYGQCFTLNLLLLKMTWILGVEGNQLFFEATDDLLNFYGAVEATSKAVFGPTAFKDMPPSWIAKNTKVIAKGFNTYSRMNLYHDTVKDEINKHITKWCGQEKVDLFKETLSLVTAINIRCVLGEDAFKTYGEEVTAIYYHLELAATDPIAFMFPSLPSPTKLRNDRSRKRLIEIITTILKNRDGQPPGKDYLSMIWQEESEGHTMQQLAMHTLGLILAANTNVANASGWTIAQLAHQHPLQAKAAAEQQKLMRDMPEEAQNLTSNFLNKMEYIDACLKEVVRCYSLLMLVRMAARDVTFKTANGTEYVIPKGRIVSASPYITNHDETVFPNPDVFDPERFNDPEVKQKLISNHRYIQFGYGPHKCAGERFGNMVIKMLLALVLRSCEVDLVGGELPEADHRKQNATPAPEKAVWVRFKPAQGKLSNC